MSTEQNYPRNMVGYGAAPPDAQWPDHARIAVQFVMNYEEGGENCVLHGDAASEAFLSEIVGAQALKGVRHVNMESIYEYGSRAGFWRMIGPLRKASAVDRFWCPHALERNPAVAAAIRDAGYDVCCHGWRWIEPFRLSEAEERDQITRAVASITATTGSRPLGWYCRYGAGENTRRLLVEEGGFLYDSDAYNDELPYWTRSARRTTWSCRTRWTPTTAASARRRAFATGDEFHQYLTECFDQLYTEGAVTPRIMSVGLHPRLSGRPGRARALGRFLDYARGHDRVWICRRIDIARTGSSTIPTSLLH